LPRRKVNEVASISRFAADESKAGETPALRFRGSFNRKATKRLGSCSLCALCALSG